MKTTGQRAEQAQQEVQNARSVLMEELDHIFDDAKQISCTRLSLAIEALIDAKIKWPPS
jgi:hypothetical protein